MVICAENSPNLGDYDDRARRIIYDYGFHSIYVVTYGNGKFCKVGIAFDPVRRLDGLQTSHPEPLRVEFLLWAPTSIIAGRVEKEAHKVLRAKGKHASREWFKVTPKGAVAAIQAGSKELYPSVDFLDHDQMARMLRSEKYARSLDQTYSDAERNLIIRTMMQDPKSPLLPKLRIDGWALLFKPKGYSVTRPV